VQNRFGFRMGRFEEIGPRAGFGLKLKVSEPQVQGRALLMGNAARTLHPVSGQGFNLAFRDVAALVDLIADKTVLTESSVEGVLAAFIKQRSQDQNRVVGFTDALVKIFRGKSPGFCHLRAAGLLAVDHLPVLKNIVVAQSTGMNAPLPKFKGISL